MFKAVVPLFEKNVTLNYHQVLPTNSPTVYTEDTTLGMNLRNIFQTLAGLMEHLRFYHRQWYLVCQMYSQLYVSISKVACPVPAISWTLSDLLLKHNTIKHTTCKAIEIHFKLPKTHPFPPTLLVNFKCFSMVWLVQKKIPNKKNINLNNECSPFFRTTHPTHLFFVVSFFGSSIQQWQDLWGTLMWAIIYWLARVILVWLSHRRCGKTSLDGWWMGVPGWWFVGSVQYETVIPGFPCFGGCLVRTSCFWRGFLERGGV